MRILLSRLSRIRQVSPQLWALGLLLAAILGGVWWVALERSNYEIAEAKIEEEARNDRLALAHEQQARAMLRTLDHALQSVIDEPALVERMLRGDAAAPPHVVSHGIQIGLIDLAGREASGLMELPSDWSRQLIAHHRAADLAESHMLAPARQPSGRGWVTTLSRALVDRQGRFSGVIYARVNPQDLLEFFQKAALGPDDAIVLVGLDGRVRARRSGANYAFDDQVVDAMLQQQSQRSPNGHFLNDSPVDGKRRFYSYRMMADYGLIAMVGTSYADVMAPVFERATRYQGLAFVGSVLLLVGTLALVLAIRRHDEAARRLRRSEQRFRALTQMSADWYWETDADHRLSELVRSPRHDTTMVTPVLGRTLWELDGVTGDDAFWSAHRAKLLRCEPFIDFEWRRTGPNGRTQVVLVSGEPVIDSRGRFHGYRGVGHDVTSQREAEAARQASEARMAGIIESAMDAIITVDGQQRIVVFNAAAAQMFRCTPQAMLGQPLERLLPKRFQADHGAHMRNFSRTPAAPRTMGRGRHVWAQRADGEEFPADASISHIEIDGVTLYSVVLRDITARLAAENALRDREESYRLLFENNLDGLLLADEEGRVDRANAAAARLLGLSTQQICERGLEVLRSPGNPLEVSLDGYRRHGQARGDFTVARPDGSLVHLEVAFAAYQDSGGRPRASVLLHDVTERHEALAAQEALASQLRQSQKMEALGSIAGGIAHDFNNVIAAILGNARLAQAKTSQASPAAAHLEEILRAGLRARELVKRIMTFSRKQPAVFVRQSLGPIVREAVALLRATLPSGIRITLREEDSPCEVLADATQLHQVVMNLGTNAWQAMGQRTGHIEITLSREPQGGSMRLSVQDDGVGMDSATQARIFEPFFTTKPDGEGTGLGLAVVQGIVHAHQGQIQVASAPGRGCRFDILLPVVSGVCDGLAAGDEPPRGALPQDPVALRPSAPAGAAARSRRIVYVDDYEAMVALVTAVLEMEGHAVSGFESSAQALDYVRQHPQAVDLLITDYNMPEMSGLDLAREVRALRPRLPIIVASGHLSADLRAGADTLGIDCLFDKPAGVDELCQRVTQLLA